MSITLQSKKMVSDCFPEARVCTTCRALAVCCLVLGVGIPSASSADMSVNGFFPADYVKSEIFAAQGASSATTVLEPAQPQPIPQWGMPGSARRAKAATVRPRSGRFVKTTQGTIRSSVQQSEWDVGATIPKK